MTRAIPILLLISLTQSSLFASDAIPAPSGQVADILVSGRSAKATRVDVAKIGQALPETFAGVALTDTDGFDWYVTRHYALKTDIGDKEAREFLELLECVYPYYVHFFGAEPAGIERKRLPVVYGASQKSLGLALKSDNIKWDFGGGGITYERIHIAYAYPSGTLHYHHRYILIHECVHLYQMCLTGRANNTPPWFCEGIADAIASHVFDEQAGRITLDVLDKGTPPNFLDQGLESLRKKPQTVRQIDGDVKVNRGLGFLLVHFLRSTPDREQRFRLWSGEMMSHSDRTHEDPAARADRIASLEKLFGPWEKLEADFAAWCKSRRNTFHYAEWGWEQDRNTFQAFGFAEGGKLSETDVLLPPGEKPVLTTWRLDYDPDAVPPTVGRIARGVLEPSVGALLDFHNDPHRGMAGIGLGVVDPAPTADGLHADHSTYLKVLVRDGQSLDIDGSDLKLPTQSVKIPASVQSAMDADHHSGGLTIVIARNELRAMLAARVPGAGAAPFVTTTLPLDASSRQRLLERPLAILARDGWQRVTPFFDEGRRPIPDPPIAAPVGRWRNPGERQLGALFRVWDRLGPHTPTFVESLRQRMLKAADATPAMQQAALEAFNHSLKTVIGDVERCNAPAETIAACVKDLKATS